MTDKRNATLAEKSEARRKRYEARSKLGLKPGDGKEAHHKDEKGKSNDGYNNSKGNLKAMSKCCHSKTESNGKRGKDCMPRKSRSK